MPCKGPPLCDSNLSIFSWWVANSIDEAHAEVLELCSLQLRWYSLHPTGWRVLTSGDRCITKTVGWGLVPSIVHWLFIDCSIHGTPPTKDIASVIRAANGICREVHLPHRFQQADRLSDGPEGWGMRHSEWSFLITSIIAITISYLTVIGRIITRIINKCLING